MRAVYGTWLQGEVKQSNFHRRVHQWMPALYRSVRGLNPGLAPRWLVLLFLVGLKLDFNLVRTLV